MTRTGAWTGAEILQRALAADPLWSQLLTARRSTMGARAVQAQMAHYLRFDERVGDVRFHPTWAGVAAWQHLDAGEPSPLWRSVDALLRRAAFGPLHHRAGRLFDQLEKSRAEVGPHQYLEFLGVEPDRQGQGIGSDLLVKGPAEEAVAAARYLETFNERNVSFYGRHGYEVVERFPTDFGCDGWAMIRPPS